MRQSQVISVAVFLKKRYPDWVKSPTIRNEIWATADRRASDLKTLWLIEKQDTYFTTQEWKKVLIAEYRMTERWLATNNDDIPWMVYNKIPRRTKDEGELKRQNKEIKIFY